MGNESASLFGSEVALTGRQAGIFIVLWFGRWVYYSCSRYHLDCCVGLVWNCGVFVFFVKAASE